MARFFCDAMLGGLARWLRAAGYEAEFEIGIDDGALVERTRASGRILLSSDGGIFERTLVHGGAVDALFVPRGLTVIEQLRFVLAERRLGVLDEPRCMPCGGALLAVPKAAVEGLLPPKSFALYEAFWRCERCERLFWKGTHWERITARLASVDPMRAPRHAG